MHWMNGILAAAALGAAPAPADEANINFALNVSRHVLLHEVAHALIREFDLPVLGNEENIADTFATVWITQQMRDDAVPILTDRARSWLIEGAEVRPEEFDLAGEHELDTRRAIRTICLLYGADPAEFPQVVTWIGLSDHDANECTDIAPQVIKGWEVVLAPHSTDAPSPNVTVQYGKASHSTDLMKAGLLEQIADVMRGFDWPEPVLLHFDSCGSEGASWSRTERRILFCDEYFDRFVRQAAMASRG